MSVVTDPRCGRSWSGRKAEHCTVCHETFTGTAPADAHRVGQHGVDRRCLPVDQVQVRRYKDQPPIGLKWNPKVQAWGWDEPKPALSEYASVDKRGFEPVPGTQVAEDREAA